MRLQVFFKALVKMACMFEPLFNQKIKIMKNLMQKLVRTTLCLGVVSLTLIACADEQVEQDVNVISLDQLDSLTNDVVEMDTTVIDSGDNIDPDGNREFELKEEVTEEEANETVEK
tara:strand:+ start:80 stop:427 length:348 start_codon:yes stop_codon:yes gene_type:complete